MEIEPTLLKVTIEEMVTLRQNLHQHPEMAFKEFATAEKVATLLESYGLEVTRGIAVTGVVGVLDNGEGPCLGLRADMDALPIHENSQLGYNSCHSGVMHACGHDGHTAMLLGAAKILSKMKGLRGKIIFIFQPAEENEGGAKAMLEAGMFNQFDVDVIYGLHNIPSIPTGTILAQPGPMTAAFDTFDIDIKGKGGHGAIPDLTCDPVVAASALVQALNTIVSRKVSPLESAVISVGKVSAGDTYNVIPDSAQIMGSCRSFNINTQEILEQHIHNMCKGIALAYNTSISCHYEKKYPAVVNDQKATENFVQAIKTQLPQTELIENFTPFMGSEDFAYFLQAKPGCYFGIGNGLDSAPLHTAQYNFNDNLMQTGISVWVAIVTHFMQV